MILVPDSVLNSDSNPLVVHVHWDPSGESSFARTRGAHIRDLHSAYSAETTNFTTFLSLCLDSQDSEKTSLGDSPPFKYYLCVCYETGLLNLRLDRYLN